MTIAKLSYGRISIPVTKQKIDIFKTRFNFIFNQINNRILKKQWRWLARLTSDLPDSKRIVIKYPVFYKTVLPEDESPDDILGSFRYRGLKKMNAGPSLLLAMDVWKEHLHLIAPDPANVYKANYTHHAAWCKAVHELNKNSYSNLLSQWRKKHSRRRNLWRDMKAIGLSV